MTKLITGEHLQQTYEVVSTGLSSLDWAVGIGGLPRGRMVEIIGRESTGKSALALSVVANAQKQGLRCVWVDAENAFDRNFATTIGVDVNSLQFVETEMGYGEEYAEAIEDIIKNKKADVIVVDSLDAVTPRAKLEAEAGQGVLGVKARFFSDLCRKIVYDLKKNNVLLILISQVRLNIMTGHEDTPGGMSIRFYSSVRLKIKQVKALTSGEKITGKKVVVTVVKNKVSIPGKAVECNYLFESGWSEEAGVVDTALEAGLITREGNTYFYKEEKLGAGLNKVREFLESNPTILEAIKSEF